MADDCSGLAGGCCGVAGGSFGFVVRCGVSVGSCEPATGCDGLSGGCCCGKQLIVVV